MSDYKFETLMFCTFLVVGAGLIYFLFDLFLI